jgi:hypothetical protein
MCLIYTENLLKLVVNFNNDVEKVQQKCLSYVTIHRTIDESIAEIGWL